VAVLSISFYLVVTPLNYSAAFNGHVEAAGTILTVAPHLITSKDCFER
jgi:hypothetical protein